MPFDMNFKGTFMLFRDMRHIIVDVIYHDPATIVFWSDGTKTVVKCNPEDTYDERIGLLLCIVKKYHGNDGSYNNILKTWLPSHKEDNENV